MVYLLKHGLVCCFILLVKCEGIFSKTVKDSDRFLLVRNASFFVDKTLLLKRIFQHDFLLVTAPHKFGKTTNLQMIKLFLGNGRRKPEVADVFRNTNIWQDKEFVVKHMCNYPVIYCNFKPNGTIKSYVDVVQAIKTAVRDAFVEHKYLMRSNKIGENTKRRYLEYCRLQVTDFEIGLTFLSKILHIHHGKRVTVLIDDFDYPMTYSIFKKDLDSTKTAELLYRLIDNTINLNEYVSKSVLVGCLPFKLGAQFSGLYLLEHFNFMTTKDFTPFFGFTTRETNNLLDKFGLGRFKKNVSDWYGGYSYLHSEFNIYNPWSVLMFLKTKKLDIHWVPPSSRGVLYDYVEPHYELKELLAALVKGKPVTIDVVKTFTSYEVDKLKNVQFASYSYGENHTEDHLFLQLLLESGYLTFAETYSTLPITTKLKFPNLEIRKVFLQILAKAAATHYDIHRRRFGQVRRPTRRSVVRYTTKRYLKWTTKRYIKWTTKRFIKWTPREKSAWRGGSYKRGFTYGTRRWGRGARGAPGWKKY